MFFVVCLHQGEAKAKWLIEGSGFLPCLSRVCSVSESWGLVGNRAVFLSPKSSFVGGGASCVKTLPLMLGTWPRNPLFHCHYMVKGNDKFISFLCSWLNPWRTAGRWLHVLVDGCLFLYVCRWGWSVTEVIQVSIAVWCPHSWMLQGLWTAVRVWSSDSSEAILVSCQLCCANHSCCIPRLVSGGSRLFHHQQISQGAEAQLPVVPWPKSGLAELGEIPNGGWLF